MITGSLVAIVTPMHEDGSLDYPRLRGLVDFHIAEGTDGIVIVGTSGESPTVDVDEHCELIRVTVEQAAEFNFEIDQTMHSRVIPIFAKKISFFLKTKNFLEIVRGELRPNRDS